MSEDKGSSASAGGVGFIGLLQVALIVLKLCNVITWSWLWVLAPTWIGALIVVGLLVILVAAAIIPVLTCTK